MIRGGFLPKNVILKNNNKSFNLLGGNNSRERCEIMKTDMELIEEVKKGNRFMFSILVRRYQKPLLGVSIRFMRDLQLAEDVVQEAFIKAYKNLKSFEGRSSFKSWMYKITINTAKNKLRIKKRVQIGIHQVCLAKDSEAEDRLIAQDVKKSVKALIDQLPLKQKTALVLRVFDDMSFKEIAGIMKCPYDTAKANYRHGILKLRRIIGSNSELRQWAVAQEDQEIEFKGFMEAES